MKHSMRLWYAVAVAALALIAGVVIQGKAQAAGLGCSLALEGGYGNTSSTASGGVAGTTLISVDSLSASGGMAGAGVGCDIVVDKILIGAFANYDWKPDTSATLTASGFGGSANASLGFGNQWTVGGRAGVVIDSTLYYVLAGRTQMATTGLSGTLASSLSDFTGITIGGGMESAIGKHVKIGLEYRHSAFDAQTAAVTSSMFNIAATDGVSATFKPTQDAVFVRLIVGSDFFGSTLFAQK